MVFVPFTNWSFPSGLLVCYLLCFGPWIPIQAEYRIQNSFQYDDHLEFGLSVDPNTSPLAGREDYQLPGFVNLTRGELNWSGTLSPRLTAQVSGQGQYLRYFGTKNLHSFNGSMAQLNSRLRIGLTDQLPHILLNHQLQRYNRVDPAFDRWEQFLDLGWGSILKYTYHQKRFDDTATRREDFQLVGFDRHQFACDWRVRFGRMLPAKFSYRFAYQRYQTNLNELVRLIAQLPRLRERADRQHQFLFRLPFLAANRLIIQPTFSHLDNRSNTPFYDYAISEGRLLGFLRFQQGQWLQLLIGRQHLQFPARRDRNRAGFRQDIQWRLEGKMSWQLSSHLTLTVDYHRYRNRTNNTSDLLTFLNFERNRYWLTIEYAG